MGVVKAKVLGQQLRGGRFIRGPSLAEVEQQPAQGERRRERGAIDAKMPLRDQVRWDGKCHPARPNAGAECQHGIVFALHQADGGGGLPCPLPGDPCLGVRALGEVDQFRQCIALLGGKRRTLGLLQCPRIAVQVRWLPQPMWRRRHLGQGQRGPPTEAGCPDQVEHEYV